MHKLIVNGKTGFRIRDGYENVPVIIRDWRGVLFYSTEDTVPNAKEFNLPDLKGPTEYYVDSGYFSKMEKPVEWNLHKLPPIERNWEDPTKFKISFGTNRNKCTINWGQGWILFDNQYKDAPLPVLYFLLYHEYAHRYYKTEKWVDSLAFNYGMKKGFNPNQFAKVPVTTLSERQTERKWHAVNQTIETNGNR